MKTQLPTKATFFAALELLDNVDYAYASKTWDQGFGMADRDEFLRKVALMLRWAAQPNHRKRARVLFHEIAGFVNDFGAMRQRLTSAEQFERDEFSADEV